MVNIDDWSSLINPAKFQVDPFQGLKRNQGKGKKDFSEQNQKKKKYNIPVIK